MRSTSASWLQTTDVNLQESEDCLCRLTEIIARLRAQVAVTRQLIIESELLRTATENPVHKNP